MLDRNLVRLAILAALIALAPAARAQDILSVTQPTGPGGTGDTAIDTQYANQGITGLLDMELTFTSVAPISFSFDVDGPGGYTLHADPGFNPNFTTGIINDTGVGWSSFVMTVATGQGAGPNGIEADSHFSSAVISSSAITLSDGLLPAGETLSAIFGVGTPSAQDVTVTFTPFAVPEPSSLVLLALGAIGGPVLYRRYARSRPAKPADAR